MNEKYIGFIIIYTIMILGFFLLALVNWKIYFGVSFVLIAYTIKIELFSGDIE